MTASPTKKTPRLKKRGTGELLKKTTIYSWGLGGGRGTVSTESRHGVGPGSCCVVSHNPGPVSESEKGGRDTCGRR